MKPKNMLKYATDWSVGDLHVTMEEQGYAILRDDGRWFMTTDGVWHKEHSLDKEDGLRFFDMLADAIRAAEADCAGRGVKDGGFNHTQD